MVVSKALSETLPQHINILQQSKDNTYINPFELEAKYGDKWRVTDKDEEKYRLLFCQKAQLNTSLPNYGLPPDRDVLHETYLSGDVLKPVFLKTGLDAQNLKELWRLSDLDKDERLSYEEFIIAMHLLKLARDSKGILPLSLPQEFISYVNRHFGPQHGKANTAFSSVNSYSYTSGSTSASSSTDEFSLQPSSSPSSLPSSSPPPPVSNPPPPMHPPALPQGPPPQLPSRPPPQLPPRPPTM